MRVPALVALAPVLVVDGNTFMSSFTDRFIQWFKPTIVAPRAGLYHFEYQEDGSRSRIHLRVDADGQGILLINAARIFHLNSSATLMAYLILHDSSPHQAINILTRKYKVTAAQAKNDYAQFKGQFEELINPNGGCPICDFNLDTLPPFSTTPNAPYRMDLAISYACNNNCSHCYNARPRNFPQLRLAQWKNVLDILWEIGVPHIVFTGGEPTLVSFLPDLIRHAEKNGQITGINTNGRLLKNSDYVQRLVDSGLDHIQVTLESHDPAIHDHMVNSTGAWKDTTGGLRNVLTTRLYVMTNTTLLRSNSPYLAETLNFLHDLGVPTVGLNSLIYSGKGESVGTGLSASDLPGLLDIARNLTQKYNQRLIWYTPTQYCHFDPVQMELGVKGCTAALYNMCIEPDGSVLPCQSYYTSLGNILTEPWNRIWNSELAIHLRERHYIPTECQACVLLAECGGGCPLELETSHPICSPIQP